MCCHAPKDGYDLYFRPGPKANKRGARIWHMKKVKEQLGKEVCKNLLFLHAITGRGMRHYIAPLWRWQGKSPEEI